jgi:hypothetical protein
MPTGTRTLPATTSRSIELPIKAKTFCVYEGPRWRRGLRITPLILAVGVRSRMASAREPQVTVWALVTGDSIV